MLKKTLIFLIILTVLLVACRGGETVEVSATPLPIVHSTDTPLFPSPTPIQPTPNPTRVAVGSVVLNEDGTYTVRPGDTLNSIATRFGITAQEIMDANGLLNPNVLEVNQVLIIPPGAEAPPTPVKSFKTIPDSELVWGPTASTFDIATYVKNKPGFLYAYSEEIGDDLRSGVEILTEIAIDYSINPRLLIALLEYQSGWLSNPTPNEAEILYPMGVRGVSGFQDQLLRAANQLNEGYYGWRYRGLTGTTFADGTPLTFDPTLNAGTVAVQYFFAQNNDPAIWQFHTSEQGFFQTYLNLWGDPFPNAIDPVPPSLQQPTFALPFASGETWYFTGGPHGGYNSGSAWSSIDFAPPAPPDTLNDEQGYCYISPNYVTAVAPGVIARSGDGYVILDLDGDGNEHTGWVVVYLHLSSEGVIGEGKQVQTGTRLGHPSCEGGFSNATHLHFGRRYNGEWIPITCHVCASDINAPPLVMSNWTFIGYVGQEYQGYAVNPNADGIRRAEQGREDPINQFSY